MPFNYPRETAGTPVGVPAAVNRSIMLTLRHVRPICLICPLWLLWLIAGQSAVWARTMSSVSGVPPGFEDIARGQVEHLDIRWLGRSLGIFPVFVRPDEVHLETPEAVVRAIGARMALREQRAPSPVPASDAATVTPQQLVEALARPMPRNGHLACHDVGTGCRYLDTDSADVIFDESSGVLELFLSKAWLPSQDVAGPAFHTNSPGSENALIHTQIVNAATSERYRNLTLLGNGALGISPASYAGFTWSLVHSRDANASRRASGTQGRIDSLYYRHDLGAAHYVQSGRMDQRNLSSAQGGSFGFVLLPMHRFDGARVGTSQAYRNEANATQGSPLTVLLTREARVDVYRGNELLGSAYFPAGVQSFDTRYFPEGSYLVSLRIFEGDTLVRTESAPFTKVGGDGAGQGTQWFVQAGRAVDRQRDIGAPDNVRSSRLTMQSGVRTSVSAGLTITSGMAWSSQAFYNETQAGWQHAFAAGRLVTSAAVLLGSDGARGNTQSISFANGVGLTLYRYQMRDASCRRGTSGVSETGASFGCHELVNASLSVPLGPWQAVAGYGENRSYGSRRAARDNGYDDPWLSGRDVQAGVSRTLQTTLSRSFRWRRLMIHARGGAYHRRHAGVALRDTGGFVSVSLSRHRPAAGGRGMSTYSSASTEVRMDDVGRGGGGGVGHGARTDYGVSHAMTWDDTSRRELSLNLNANERGMGTANVRGAVDGRYGDAHVALSRTLFGVGEGGETRSSYVGGYASSLVVARQGVRVGPAMLSGEPPAGVALAVDSTVDAAIDSAIEAAVEDVGDAGLADSEDRASGEIAATLHVDGRSLPVALGSWALAPVGGYRALKGEVSETRHGAVDHTVGLIRGAGQYDDFLTPGRLKIHRVVADRTYTYVGRAVGPDGLAMDNARVLSAVAPPLDAQGTFMIESPRRLTHLYLLIDAQPMRCDIRVAQRQDVVHLTEVSHCTHVAQHALPASLLSQSRVQRLLGEAGSPAGRQVTLRRSDARTY
ncbi:TcfC E-set like domain-containing protein [Pandoraea captiosa]|nr:TcfC E-set like domain-containing protein [Pandoraea captiosa]